MTPRTVHLHHEILAKKQAEMLPLLAACARRFGFGMVGGTAIALHIGHRRSIDFDLFTNTPFDTLSLRQLLRTFAPITRVFVDHDGEYTVLVKGVKLTFLLYPFPLRFRSSFEGIPMADLLTLAALKAYALGRRAKWKDYVDVYWIMRRRHPIERIVAKSKSIFGKEFNEKLFRAQLVFFYDLDRSEKVISMKGFAVADKEIQKELVQWSVREKAGKMKK
ncbi:MAG: hypothetical protein AAB932_02860 [Patescibacteria group bacterium]